MATTSNQTATPAPGATASNQTAQQQGGGAPGTRGQRRKYRKQLRRFKANQAVKKDWRKYENAKRKDTGLTPELPFSADLERTLSGYQQKGDVASARADEDLAAAYSGQIDPSNPFSQQALLQRELHQGMKSNLASKAAGGNLYDGSLVSADESLQFDAQRAQDTLARGYTEQVTDIARGRDDTLAGLSSQAEDAIWQHAQATANTPGDGTGIPLGPRKPKKKVRKNLTRPVRPY